jgi:hypothetical protein
LYLYNNYNIKPIHYIELGHNASSLFSSHALFFLESGVFMSTLPNANLHTIHTSMLAGQVEVDGEAEVGLINMWHIQVWQGHRFSTRHTTLLRIASTHACAYLVN